MKQYIKAILLSLIMVSTYFSVFGQDEQENTENKWSAQLNLSHQDLLFDISFGQLGVVYPVSIRPQYSLEVQRSFLSKKGKKRILLGQVGYYNNLYHNKWYNIQIGYMKETTIFKGLYAAWGLEIGMALVKDSDPQYVFVDDKWMLSENFVPVHADLTFGPRLDIGYRIIDNEHPIDVLLTNDLTLRIDPELGGFPYYSTGLGIRYGF